MPRHDCKDLFVSIAGNLDICHCNCHLASRVMTTFSRAVRDYDRNRDRDRCGVSICNRDRRGIHCRDCICVCAAMSAAVSEIQSEISLVISPVLNDVHWD